MESRLGSADLSSRMTNVLKRVVAALALVGALLAIAGCSNNGTSSGPEMCREEANPDKRDYPGDGALRKSK